MPLVEKRIYRISDNLSSLNPQQIGVQNVADTDLGYKLYGGKDDAGVLSYWPAKDKAARFSTLGLIGGSTTGEDGLLRHDTDGNITGGELTIEDLNDLLTGGEVGLWQRDGVNNVVSPATVGDRVKVGAGTVAIPGIAIGDSNTGGYFDLATSRLCLAMDGAPSWQFELTDTDVHRIIVGDDQTSPNQRYLYIEWEESDSGSESAALIENYRASGAPGNGGHFTISNTAQDGLSSSMTVKNFHPENSELYLQANGSGNTLIDINSGGGISEIKNTADKITMYGQVQGSDGSAAAPAYSWMSKPNDGWYYSSSRTRFAVNGTEAFSIWDQYESYLVEFASPRQMSFTTTTNPAFTFTASNTNDALAASYRFYSTDASSAGNVARFERYVRSNNGVATDEVKVMGPGGTPNKRINIIRNVDTSGAVSLSSVVRNIDSGGATMDLWTESHSGDDSKIKLYAEVDSTTGTPVAELDLFSKISDTNGTSYVYIGTDKTDWTDWVYLADDNRSAASPAWTSPGVLLSTNTAAWDNYKSKFGEVGLMDAIYMSATSAGGGLDDAYDYPTAGAGKSVTVDSGSISLTIPVDIVGDHSALALTNLKNDNTGNLLLMHNQADLSTGYMIYFMGDQGGDDTDDGELGHKIWTQGSMTIGHHTGSGATLKQSYMSCQYNGTGTFDWSTLLLRSDWNNSAYYSWIKVEAGLNDGANYGRIQMEATNDITIQPDGYLRLQSDNNDIFINASSDIEFTDGNHSGSSWTQGHVKLSDATSGWSNYETAHGEVGMMEAIAHAGFVGRCIHEASSDGPSSTTAGSGSPANKLSTTTPSLTSGVGYVVFYSVELGADADCDVGVEVELDNTTMIAEPYYDNDLYSTRYEAQSGFYYSNSFSGTVQIDIDYFRGYGTGFARIRRARVAVFQVD